MANARGRVMLGVVFAIHRNWIIGATDCCWSICNAARQGVRTVRERLSTSKARYLRLLQIPGLFSGRPMALDSPFVLHNLCN